MKNALPDNTVEEIDFELEKRVVTEADRRRTRTLLIDVRRHIVNKDMERLQEDVRRIEVMINRLDR